MKLIQKVNIKGYNKGGDKLPVYLADDLEEEVGGKKPCKVVASLAALDDTQKSAGQSPLIIVVSKAFLRMSRKNRLAILAYFNALPEQEKYDFYTKKGAELAAKMEVVAEYGKLRFKRAFRKFEKKERHAVVASAGNVHREYSKAKKELKKAGFDPDEESDEWEFDAVKFAEDNGHDVMITSYKSASLTPVESGVNPFASENQIMFPEQDIIDEGDDRDTTAVIRPNKQNAVATAAPATV